MLRTYLPAIVFLVLGGLVGALFVSASSLLGPKRKTPPTTYQTDPYECGLPSDVQQGFRFGISFYLIAMLFILFDIEVLFLYPIAVSCTRSAPSRWSRRSSSSRSCCVAFVYVWRRGALEWKLERTAWRSSSARSRARRRTSAIRQLQARDMLRGDLEGEDLEQLRRGSVITDDARQGRRLGARQLALPADLRPGLLRHRDDVDRRRAARHRALRLRGLPRLAASGRPPDSLGPRLDQDGAGRPPHLRPDARAQVRHRDGRLLARRGASSTTTPSSRPTSSCRSTCTCPAARRAPRR